MSSKPLIRTNVSSFEEVRHALQSLNQILGGHTHAASDIVSGIIADARMPDLTGEVTTTEGAVATTVDKTAISNRTELTSGQVASGDMLLLGDTSASNALKKATVANVVQPLIGVSVQAYDADLDIYAGITPSANIQSLLAAASYAAMRALLDLEAGTDFYSIAAANAAFLRVANNLSDVANAATARSNLSAAPNNVSYLTLATDTELTSERVATAGSGVSIGDGGAGGNVTFALDINGLSAETAIADGDEIPIRDISEGANNKITRDNLMSFAVQADQETGTSTKKPVTPGIQHYHDSAAKGWTNWTISGTTITERDSYNVSSVTRTAVGTVQVAWATDFSSDYYACFVTGTAVAGYNGAMLAATVDCYFENSVHALTDNYAQASCAAFGDQA